MGKSMKKNSSPNRKRTATRLNRSRSEYAAEQRERDTFLDRMNITDPVLRDAYARAQSSRFDLADIMMVTDPDERLVLIQSMIEKRARSIDRAAHVLVPERTSLRPSMRIDSKASQAVFADHESTRRTLFALGRIRDEFAQRDAEIMHLEIEYLAHFASLTECETKVVHALDPGPAALARILELYGHLRTMKGPSAAAFVEDLITFLEENGHGRPVDKLVRDRLKALLVTNLDTEAHAKGFPTCETDDEPSKATLHNAKSVQWNSHLVAEEGLGRRDPTQSFSSNRPTLAGDVRGGDVSNEDHHAASAQLQDDPYSEFIPAAPLHDNEAVPATPRAGEGANDGDKVKGPVPASSNLPNLHSGRTDRVSPADGSGGNDDALGSGGSDRPESWSSSDQLMSELSAGLSDISRGDWFESEFERGTMSPFRPHMSARIDEREPVSGHVRMIMTHGVPHEDYWSKPNLSKSSLRLVQRAGRSPQLPSFRPHFLPPATTFTALADYAGKDAADGKGFSLWGSMKTPSGRNYQSSDPILASFEDLDAMVLQAILRSVESLRTIHPNVDIDAAQTRMLTRYWVILLLSENCPERLSTMATSYVSGVHGHDPGLGDAGYFEVHAHSN